MTAGKDPSPFTGPDVFTAIVLIAAALPAVGAAQIGSNAAPPVTWRAHESARSSDVMTDGKDQSPVRRPVMITAVLLVSAAVLLVALRPWLAAQPDIVDSGARLESESAQVPETVPAAVQQAVEGPVAAVMPVSTSIVPASDAAPAAIKIVLLPNRLEDPDPIAAVMVEAVRQVMLRVLRASTKVAVIEVTEAELAGVVPPNAGSFNENNIAPLAVLRRYEAGAVAEISDRSALPGVPLLGVNLDVRWENGSRSTSNGAMSKTGNAGSDIVPGALRIGNNDPESLGVNFAQTILQRVGDVSSSNAVPAETRAALLDASRPESERVGLLVDILGWGQILDPELRAAAVDLGAHAESPGIRRFVWTLLRRVAYDPALAQPLSMALASDPDATVRREAALALAFYRGDGTSEASLAQAMRNDSSAEVRLAARMSMMDLEQQQAFSRETLRDQSLTPAERLAPAAMLRLEPAARLNPLLSDAEIEDAAIYAEIVSLSDDPEVRLSALSQLQRIVALGRARNLERIVDDPEITQALIDSANDEDRRVRREALTALRRLTDDPAVRAVLESVVANEPNLALELDFRNYSRRVKRNDAGWR